jgi:outer membrane protein assembly factor BamB
MILPSIAAPVLALALFGMPAQPAVETVDWPQQGFNAAHTGYNPHEKTLSRSNVAGLKLVGKFSTGARIISNIAVVDGVAYILSRDGYLYAVDVSTQTQVWKFSASTPGNRGPQGLALETGRVFVTCLVDSVHGYSGLCALNAKSGRLVWSWAYVPPPSVGGGSLPSTPPTVSNGVVYLGESGSYFYRMVGLDAKTGKVLSEWGTCTPSGYCDSVGSSLPAVGNGIVYFGCSHPYSFSNLHDGLCASKNGVLQWFLYTSDANSAASFADGVVYSTSLCPLCYEQVSALNAANGATVWSTFQPIGAINCGNGGAPALTRDVVYVGSVGCRSGLFALERKTGKLLWYDQYALNWYSAPSVANGVVYGPCRGGTCAYNASSGKQLWTAGQGNGSRVAPDIANGTVYGVCNDTDLCTYHL